MSELKNLIEDIVEKIEGDAHDEAPTDTPTSEVPAEVPDKNAAVTAVLTFVQYDSVNPAEIPASANEPNVGVAGYVGGRWPDYSPIVARFPRARHKSVAVNASEGADILDVENGDAVPADAPAWFRRQKGRGLKKPGFYANASTMPEVISILRKSGIGRDEYVLWVAHYTDKTPSYPFELGADAVQWTSDAEGKDLDQSIAVDSFWDISEPAKPIVNHVNYSWFDGTEVEYRGLLITERGSVKDYDKFRANAQVYGEQIKDFRERMQFFADRVYNNAMAGVKPGQRAHWAEFHRGWRFQQLIHRAEGERIA